MISREKYFLIDFATTVNTFEMEPKIKFGYTIFVHKTKQIQEGDIVLFEYHGKIHIAVYEIDEKKEIEIFSPINKSKDAIINSKKIHIIGKIICWNTP
jgi:phage repressor protein C with HTH and peptisase S24 domain